MAFAAIVIVAEGDDAVPVLKPDRARGLEARRVEARELVEEDGPRRFRVLACLVCGHHLCGIIIPQVVAAATCARSRAGRIGMEFGWAATSLGCGSHAPRFPVADGSRGAAASNRVKPIIKAFNLASGVPRHQHRFRSPGARQGE